MKARTADCSGVGLPGLSWRKSRKMNVLLLCLFFLRHLTFLCLFMFILHCLWLSGYGNPDSISSVRVTDVICSRKVLLPGISKPSNRKVHGVKGIFQFYYFIRLQCNEEILYHHILSTRGRV